MIRYIYSTIKTMNGIKKSIQIIRKVHANSVLLDSGNTQMKSMLEEINDWIPINEIHPEVGVMALGHQDEIITGYISEDPHDSVDEDTHKYVCENDYEYMDEVTHWRPIPLTIKERKEILNR